MKSNHQLAARFREVLLNGTWIANTNYKDQLENLPLQLAQTKVGHLNTIAILAQHIHYYIKGVANVFKGGPLEIRDADSFDFPAFASEAEWQSFLTTFFNSSLASLLIFLIETLLFSPIDLIIFFISFLLSSLKSGIGNLIS